MTILSNTLTPVVETVTDPGDYPNGAASSAEPPYRAVTRIDGCVKVSATDREIVDRFPVMDDGEEYQPIPGIRITGWETERFREGAAIWYECTVTAFDASQFAEPEFEEE